MNTTDMTSAKKNSLETIENRILADARAYEKQALAEAEKELDEIRADYASRAASLRASILSAAENIAASKLAAASSAKASADRNAVLKKKTVLLEKVYDKAAEAVKALDKPQYLAVFASYLKGALAACGKGELTLTAGSGSPVTASELLAAAGEAAKDVRAADAFGDFDGGFRLESTDVTVDCSLKTVIGALREKTELACAEILFEGENK